ncbi:hypothetical protein [Acetivibrio cellulolyticus]|uniref:hypothetical protein n=1 Tax=Acetivibrio cellulolyticus TaxID=35830 RepID=UPI0001E2BE49|nr:hypothetical protein [Acetivibrio cellulolyticus]
MKNNFIDNMVLKNNIVFLIINIIITLIVVNITKPYYINIYNFFCGPFDIEFENLNSIRELKDTFDYEDYIEHPLYANYYINGNKFFYKVKGNKSIQSGVQDVQEGYVTFGGVKSETQSMARSEYLLLNVNEKTLIVRVPVNSSNTEFSGLILPLSSRLKHEARLSVQDTELAEFDETLLPFMLDATGNFKKDLYYQLAIAILLFAFIIVNYCKITIRFINPRKHPLYKKIEIYGPNDEIVESIMKEVMDYGNSYIEGNYIITTNWIVKKSLFRPCITKNYIKKE